MALSCHHSRGWGWVGSTEGNMSKKICRREVFFHFADRREVSKDGHWYPPTTFCAIGVNARNNMLASQGNDQDNYKNHEYIERWNKFKRRTPGLLRVDAGSFMFLLLSIGHESCTPDFGLILKLLPAVGDTHKRFRGGVESLRRQVSFLMGAERRTKGSSVVVLRRVMDLKHWPGVPKPPTARNILHLSRCSGLSDASMTLGGGIIYGPHFTWMPADSGLVPDTP